MLQSFLKLIGLKLASLAIALALAGCSTAGNSDIAFPMQVAQLQSTANSPTTSYGPYALRPNDQVRVQVYNEPDITGDYQVDSAGYLSIPLAGRVKAAGLTASQLERSITSRLKGGILNDPRVTIQVSTYAPIYIHGEVKKSGEFPFRPGLTVMDAVAAAGGFTYPADDSRAYVRRSGTSAESVYPLDARVLVFPGDNIRIPERYF
jgi:protein involved in polysaccharide export with SLBB domain